MASERRSGPETNRLTILDAAARLFLDQGFAGTTVSEIARAAGVAKSLIHHHFGSKLSLWTVVKHERFFPAVERELRCLIELDEPSALRGRMLEYFRSMELKSNHLRLMCWLVLDEAAVESALLDDLRAHSLGQIRAAQAQGRIRSDLEPEHILIGFVGLMQAWNFNRLLRSSDDGMAYFESMWKVFSRGVLLEGEPSNAVVSSTTVRHSPPTQIRTGGVSTPSSDETPLL